MPLTPRDRRTLIIGGVVMAGIFVAFILFNLLVNGTTSAGPSLAPLNPSGATTSPTGGPTTGPPVTGTPTVGPPTLQPSLAFTGRDPFSVPPALQSASPTTGGGSGSGTGTGTGTSTSTSTNTTPPTNPGGGSSIVIGGHTVVLLDTFSRHGTPMAQVEVDGVVYQVAVGQTFASGRFELRSASGGCATFLFGDQPFSLCATASK